ncbi:hypothetical protein CFN78_15270 [Amycolatopsis antarctica]|uniref:Uncharacterized protein n=1 Tax=Amycolatopsis antarctica TaxID=1854586 RepID=A0A263D4Q3_9PSEU|nr:hypothetical protein [Amycolatopsis antarctica]OZM72355.1 hypothetical protein CFN78_15270 [Amycolatopsis antarctica]
MTGPTAVSAAADTGTVDAPLGRQPVGIAEGRSFVVTGIALVETIGGARESMSVPAIEVGGHAPVADLVAARAGAMTA